MSGGENNDVQGNLLMQDLQNNEEFLAARRKELENIHRTAAEIKGTTDKMLNQVNEQGAILDEIEVKVDDTKKNVEKGKKEITEAEQISKRNNKRFWCLIIIILIAIGGITAILISLL